MHSSLIFGLAAVAAAAPKPLLGLDLPVVSDIDLPIVSELDTDPQVEDLLTKVEDLTHLDTLLDFDLPEVKTILEDLEKLLHLGLPLETELPDIQVLLSEVESLVGGDVPSVSELLAEVEPIIADVVDVDLLRQLPTVQEVLLEIDSLTEGLNTRRGLVVDIEDKGVDILNSQDVVPLENTLSEFKTGPSGTKTSPSSSPSPSKGMKFTTPSEKGEAKGTKYISTFDDLEPLVGQVAIQEVGPYNSLDYNGIDLVELGVFGTIVTGVVPNTPPNAGAYGLTTALLNGLPNITSDYTGSVVDSFDFESFYFGCVKGTVEAIVGLPLSCNVTATGYKHEKAVAEETFVFTFNTLVDGETKNMTKAELPKSFKDLDTVTFETSYDLNSLIGATLLDTLSYTTYTKKDSTAFAPKSSGSAWPSPSAKPSTTWQ